MRLDSTSQKDEGGAGISSASVPLLKSPASAEGTSQCVQRLPTMASSITKLPIGPYNTAHLIRFLDTLHNTLIPPDQIDGPEQLRYVVIWDSVSFHRAALVPNCFTAHPHFLVVYLPPYSPFLNPIEEFFSAWRWKVYDRNPQMRIPLLQAMEDRMWRNSSRCFSWLDSPC